MVGPRDLPLWTDDTAGFWHRERRHQSALMEKRPKCWAPPPLQGSPSTAISLLDRQSQKAKLSRNGLLGEKRRRNCDKIQPFFKVGVAPSAPAGCKPRRTRGCCCSCPHAPLYQHDGESLGRRRLFGTISWSSYASECGHGRQQPSVAVAGGCFSPGTQLLLPLEGLMLSMAGHSDCPFQRGIQPPAPSSQTWGWGRCAARSITADSSPSFISPGRETSVGSERHRVPL